ncbi:MAG: TatD family hydrolase [Candidatus Gracilibacteria bacterium]|nr:TatD family hydrolase [Candidatus Gracilibacteria bacterium]
MFFDTHCHTYLTKSKSENELLNEIKVKGNLKITNIGVDLDTSKHIISLLKEYDFMYGSIGIQPLDIIKYIDLDFVIGELEELSKNKKIVAIGECGLDYYWLEKDISELLEKDTTNSKSFDDLLNDGKINQQNWFTNQVLLAKKLNLPLIIHNRGAREDIFEILKNYDFKNFVMHCYSEDYDFAMKLINFSPDCKISFSGIVTFKNAKEVQETASKIPLKNILIETDAPYLAPVPFRGKENFPFLVENVFEKICELRSENREKILEQIYENSLNFFNI